MHARFLAPLLAFQLVGTLYAADIVGLIGGNGPDGYYAALVHEDFTTTSIPLTPMPVPGGIIYSVDIGTSLHALVGGFTGAPIPFAALIQPDQTVINLTTAMGFPAGGRIWSVSINDTGYGMIGGYEQAAPTQFYGAMVTPTGILTTFTQDPMYPAYSTDGVYNAVAINSNGNGIAAGSFSSGANNVFVGLVNSLGQIRNIDLSMMAPTTEDGNLYSAKINSQNYAIAGGHSNPGTGPRAVAALIDPTGAVAPIGPISIAASTSSEIIATDINESGTGIIVGTDYAAMPNLGYAAFVSPYPAAATTEVSLMGVSTTVYSGAINNSGVGVIGGLNGANAFAAFIYQDQTVSPINLGFMGGQIYWVAINDAGLALIGGEDPMQMFAALVAPDLTVNPLTGLFPTGFIGSTSLLSTPEPAPTPSPHTILALATPSSAGPYASVLNSSLSISNALNSHIMVHHKRLSAGDEFDRRTDVAALLADAAFGEKADAGKSLGMSILRKSNPPVADSQLEPEELPEPSSMPQMKRSKEGGYTAYLFPFYDRIHQSSQGAIPAISNDIGGALAALEYTTVSDIVIGGGLSYAFNYAHYSNRLGHATVNQEMAVLYASFNRDQFFANLSLWGGLYQLENKRHTTIISATSIFKTDGWLLDPHLEVSYTWNNDCRWFFFEPFAMADWVSNWQKHGTEKGSSGLNLVLDSEWNSLLRSEAGFRFYESLSYDWGRFLLTEKASYINRTPFGFGSVSTFFVGGSASAFTVENGTTETQNLAGVQLNLSFLPCDDCYPYGAIDAQGEFGSSFQSYFIGFEIGKKF